MIKNRLFIAFCLLLGLMPVIFGQNIAPVVEWQKCFGGDEIDEIKSVVATSDGGYIFAGSAFSQNGDLTGVAQHNFLDIWVVKLTANRTIQWQRRYGGTVSEWVTAIIQTADGGYVLLGKTLSNNGDVSGYHGGADIWVVKLSALGVVEWQKCLGGSNSETPGSIQQTKEGGYILVGVTSSYDGDVTGSHTNGDAWVVKLSAVGVIEWQKYFGGTRDEILVSVQQTSDNGYIACGYTNSTNGIFTNHSNFTSDAWVIKLSSTGVQEWHKLLGGFDKDFAKSIIQTVDGGYIMTGQAHSLDGDVTGNHGNGDIWVAKLSATGVIQWQKALGGSSSEDAFGVIHAADGGYLVVGETNSNNGDVQGALSGDIWLIKLSVQGTVLWKKPLGGNMSEWGGAIMQTLDGGCIVAGVTDSNSGMVSGNHTNSFGLPTRDGWLVKLLPQSKAVRGQVEKNNTLCQSLIPPQYAPYATLKIEKNSTSAYFTTADAVGRFNILCDTGRYEVSALPFNNLWAACPSIPMILSDISQDTTTVNPALYINSICPLMEVQLTTPFLRRCFESQYVINYANRGTAVQENATAELTLDSSLTLVSATQTILSQVGKTITFSLGNVGINQTGQFTVNVMVSCNSILGQTHCSSVLIPKTRVCDTVQDSIPTIVSQCRAGCDSVSFLVSKPNTTLNKTFKYQLIADSTLMDTGRFILSNTFSLKRKTDGKTYRLEIRNPVTNQLLAARSVESPPTVSTPSVSTGFVNQFSQSIKQANISDNCTANRGSFDPNDKAAVPTGIGTRHFIEQGNTIEYLVQFQNTGTDTAFKVVVKDTLATHFDWSTFKLNAQSHTATWQLNPQGILVVTFNNINLVDSFTNERGSHGFFKYSIKLKDSIVTNTIVTNKAAIYFDFNAPIITNLTSHTIGKEGLKSCLAKPTIDVTYSGCPSKNIVFNAISTSAGTNPTYAWYRNSETTPLSTTARFTLANASNGTKIYCKLNASDDICTETPVVTSDTIVLNCIGVPTNELSVIQIFDVFPNPNKGVFTVKLNTEKSSKMRLDILNYLGQTIKSETISSDNYIETFDLSTMPNGIYLIKLTIDGRSVVKKVSVQ